MINERSSSNLLKLLLKICEFLIKTSFLHIQDFRTNLHNQTKLIAEKHSRGHPQVNNSRSSNKYNLQNKQVRKNRFSRTQLQCFF